MTENNRKSTIILVMSLIFLLVLVIGITYAVFNYNRKGEITNKLSTGTIFVEFTEDTDSVSLTNLIPMSDEEGKARDDSGNTFEFSVHSKATNLDGVNYEIMAVKQEDSTLANEDVRIYLEKKVNSQTVHNDNYESAYEPTGYIPITKDDNYGTNGAKVGDMIIERANIKTDTTVNYRLKMWVSENCLLSEEGQSFKVKVKAYGTDEKKENLVYQDISGANAPEIRGDMIPVIYDVGGKNWVKADITGEWYNYTNQMWANVVTIKQTERQKYLDAVPGTKIDIENEVNTMWVWIPRYSYTLYGTLGHKLDNVNASDPSKLTPGAFDIKFVPSTTTENGAGTYTASGSPSGYYTPSSFCWGDTCDDPGTRNNSGNKELSGLWVSKFEITGTIGNITSKPNEDAVRNQTHSAFFNAIKNQMNGTPGTNTYGFKTGPNKSYDTHMIKNTEWGAMAYLSQSQYGKYGNSAYSEADKEIYMNNYYSNADKSDGGQTKTGCSAGNSISKFNSKCLYEYDYIEEGKGVGASTTGTIYGVYDVSGGAWEKVMGLFDGVVKDSGFNTTTLPLPAQRYWNKYSDTISSIKGDATKETENFYGDCAYYIVSDAPWYVRGADWTYISSAGAFSLGSNLGKAAFGESSRLVFVAD